MTSCLSYALFILCFLSLDKHFPVANAAVTSSSSRSISIMNESGSRIQIFWINAKTAESVLLSDPHVYDGATFPLNTYVGHSFEIRELPSPKTGTCHQGNDKTCKIAYYTIAEEIDQVVRVDPGLKIVKTTKAGAFVDANAVIDKCQKRALQMIMEQSSTSSSSVQDKQQDASYVQLIHDLTDCVETGFVEKLKSANEEISFQTKIRKEIAATLENYTCTDDSNPTTPDESTYTWHHNVTISCQENHDDGGGQSERICTQVPTPSNNTDYDPPRLVHVKHDRPSSQIHVIENFINPDECLAMEEAARPTLHRATVADGKGGSRLSQNRKAMQAGIRVNWDKEEEGDPIARISRRVYDYTNHVLGLNIQEHGQEDLMSIQYFGRGLNDTEPDRYTPHCDGDCTGLPHKTGTRMATMVLYCVIPTRGGSTNFRNAGVHIRPKAGNGVFFSYINPDTLVTDMGLTEHSGCPVYEGEKKIVTQWIRKGVDHGNPWDSFNTLGIKISEANDQ